MAPALQVKALSALVKVKIADADGNPVYRVIGADQDGKAMTEQSWRLQLVQRGQELPDGMLDGEVEKLKAQNAVGTAEEVAAVGQRALEGDQPAADTAAGEAPLDLSNLAALSDADLAAAIGEHKPTVKELVTAVGDDPALAQRVLDAEKTATEGDARSSLVEKLGKVISAGEEKNG